MRHQSKWKISEKKKKKCTDFVVNVSGSREAALNHSWFIYLYICKYSSYFAVVQSVILKGIWKLYTLFAFVSFLHLFVSAIEVNCQVDSNIIIHSPRFGIHNGITFDFSKK